MTYYLSRRSFLRSLGTAACGVMMTRALHAEDTERQSPNFVVILTDDQSGVGSSVLMDPNDTRTRSDYYQTHHIDRLAKMGMRFQQGYSPATFCCPHAAACSLARPRPGTSMRRPGKIRAGRKESRTASLRSVSTARTIDYSTGNSFLAAH